MNSKPFEHIVIFHPAAIGDAMLATPVSSVLKRNFHKAKITYWTHESLSPVIKNMCPSVDDLVAYKRGEKIFTLASTLKSLDADLFVDLSNSLKGKLIPFLSRTRAVHYKKKTDGVKPIQHAADNFLDTVRNLVEEVPEKLFPTVFPDETYLHSVKKELLKDCRKPLIGLVPGVGKLRPNRAWSEESFHELIQTLVVRGTHTPLLIGGPDESELGERLASRNSGQVINFCGRIDLAQTAVVLKECQLVVSGDTGPAHIAVAVGRPVVGLYGPTAFERSGPYGCVDLAIDRQSQCRCQYEKQCKYSLAGTAGECMSGIKVDEVLQKIDGVLLAQETI